MRRDERIDALGDCGERGKTPIKREPEAFAAGVTQGKERGFGAARDLAIGRDVLNGALERGAGYFGKLCGDFLVGA